MTADIREAALASFRHRADYGEVTNRDRWIVRAVNAWVRAALPPLLSSAPAPGAVLDVGCGEQPFRTLIESSGQRYVGMDVVQNRANSVDILSTLENAPLPATPYQLILCTEVLEHVGDIAAAFAGLRRSVAGNGLVVLTVPFVFPLHMEPYDFRRLTLHGIERLAIDHGFRVETSARLGGLPELLATFVSDASVLPTSPSWLAKAKVASLRIAFAALVRLFDAPTWSRGIVINSNGYLTNGIVLRAV